jgi:hypothetical protein
VQGGRRKRRNWRRSKREEEEGEGRREEMIERREGREQREEREERKAIQFFVVNFFFRPTANQKWIASWKKKLKTVSKFYLP